jgi:GTP-binding protein
VIIRSVELAGVLATPDGPRPPPLPEIAFSGRSNVGKSSLINTLLRRTRSRVARVSATPGKTRTVNFYDVNGTFYLVDLPGFGYAKVPRRVRDAWKELMEGYLAGNPNLLGVVHLVDSRRPPTPLDHEMVEYLAGLGVPTLIILTKADKLKGGRREEAPREAAAALEVDEEQVLLFSSRTGRGRDELLGALSALLAPPDDG